LKRYKVTGKDKTILIKKVAEKLNTEISRIAYKTIEESSDKVVLEVWIKEESSENLKTTLISKEKVIVNNSGDIKKSNSTIKEKQELENKNIKEKNDENIKENKIKLSITKEGVYLKINFGDVPFNEVINLISERSIEAPEVNKINQAYENRGENIKIAEYYEGLYVSSIIEIIISEDKMEAYMNFTEPKGLELPKLKDVLEKIREFKITYGIQEENIIQAIKEKKYNLDIVVAKGTKPVNGENASVKYHINSVARKNSLKPTLLDDGKVDFKNLDIIENVEEGAILAEKINATKGKNGFNVFGEEITAKDGRDINLSKGKNTYISDDGNKIISEISGMVSCRDKKISVLDTFVIDSVGISTGNIDFVGNVIVKGDIMPDYSVRATGNIEVKGNVEKAALYAEGDIVIRGSFFGKGSGKVEAQGDVILNFAESSTIQADGNIIANEALMNCKVYSQKKITVIDKKGVIVGGEIKAAEGIEAINLGSNRGIKTDIEVGNNPQIVEEQRKIELEIEDMIKKMQQIEKNIAVLSKLKTAGQLEPEKEDFLNQLISAKFITTKTISDLKIQIEDNTEKGNEVKNATVNVHAYCYPGIKIKIRKGTYFVKEELQNVKFYYEKADVKFTSLV